MPVSAGIPFKVVIAGGGLGGLAAAIALRGNGREIIVLEATQMNKEIGAAVSLQPNAVRILENWGIREDLESRGGLVDRGFQIYNTDGTIHQRIPFQTADFGSDRVLWHRVDLHNGLKALAVDPKRPGKPAEIRVGCKVISCDPDAGTVTLQSGEVVQGDLIIGADGIHSKLRKEVVGQERDAIPTGLSAYRMIIPKEKVAHIPEVAQFMSSRDAWTTMVMAHNCRVIMGPCRNADLLSIVALVPDAQMNETSQMSWTSVGSIEDCLKSFAEFPDWIKETFKATPDLGLWQLRDLDPLDTWVKGKLILIGDAAHAMLPTQGQGASQSFEDAEALGAFFSDIHERISATQTNSILNTVFKARYNRVSLIQGYSRQQARPATEKQSNVIKLNVQEFMHYNCHYEGAKKWLAAQESQDNGSELL